MSIQIRRELTDEHENDECVDKVDDNRGHQAEEDDHHNGETCKKDSQSISNMNVPSSTHNTYSLRQHHPRAR